MWENHKSLGFVLQPKISMVNWGHLKIKGRAIHSRSKRGLLDVVRKASKFLFGTATEDDIRDLREHYNQLLSIPAENRRVINLNYRKIAQLETYLNKLLEHTNKLTNVVNKALQRLDKLTDLFLMDQTLYVIDTILTLVLAVNKEIITNMIDAAENKVTPSLFPM